MRAPQVLEDPCHPSHGGQFLWASPRGRRYTRAHTCSHSLSVLLGVRGVCTGGGDRGEEDLKIKSVTVSIVSPSICHEEIGPDAMILVF